MVRGNSGSAPWRGPNDSSNTICRRHAAGAAAKLKILRRRGAEPVESVTRLRFSCKQCRADERAVRRRTTVAVRHCGRGYSERMVSSGLMRVERRAGM